jgi:hypothetical protein
MQRQNDSFEAILPVDIAYITSLPKISIAPLFSLAVAQKTSTVG